MHDISYILSLFKMIECLKMMVAYYPTRVLANEVLESIRLRIGVIPLTLSLIKITAQT